MKIEPEKAAFLYDELFAIINQSSRSKNHRVSLLRSLYEKVFFMATEDVLISFPNAYARQIYTQNVLSFSEIENNELHSARKLMNKVLRDPDQEITSVQIFLCSKAIADLIRKISSIDVPNEIKSFYEDLKNETLGFFLLKDLGKTIEIVRAIVTDINDQKKDNGNETYTLISCKDIDEEISDFHLLIPFSNSNFSYLAKRIWKGARINAYNLIKSKINKNYYEISNSSHIILEPDNIINASEIAECFQNRNINYLSFVLKKIIKSEGSYLAMQGIIIGEVLDALVKSPEMLLSEIIENSKITNALGIAKYGQETMNVIFENIENIHLNNLKELAAYESDYPKTLEPTFISEKYGLLGRLDVLIDKETSKDVVEVKSGASPNYDVWQNNKYQAVSYSCLLKSTYENRRGVNTIFYSKSEDPHRSVVAGFSEESALLKVRNLIAYIIHKFRKGEIADVLSHINNENSGWPPYSVAQVDKFSVIYKNADPVVKVYYEQMIAFQIRELLSAKTGDDPDLVKYSNGFASLWLDDHLKKQENGQGIYDALNKNYDPVSKVIGLSYNKDLPHAFRKNDLVILYPKTENNYNALKNAILKAVIISINDEEISLQLRSKETDTSFINKYKFWAIESDFYESNYWSSIQSLFLFLSARKEKQNMLMGGTEPRTSEHQFKTIEPSYGNQNYVIKEALQAKDYYLIQGPPGTGKTSAVMINIVKQYLENNSGNIFIGALTNRAVDEIVIKLCLNSITFSIISNKDHENAFHNQVKALSNIDDWKQLLIDNRVIVSTIAGLKSKYQYLDYLSKNLLIIDEASQVTESEIIGLVSLFDKFILIGDQNQLPPVVTQNKINCIVSNSDLNELGIKNFRISLFERLYKNAKEKKWKHVYEQLDAHFRMHRNIADLIREHYDENGLKEQLPEQMDLEFPDRYRKQSDPVSNVLANSNMIFITSDRSEFSKKHDQEAKRIKQIVERIKNAYGSEFSKNAIGIIAPWRVQVVNIKKELGDSLNKIIPVDTVERFQGSQNDIIIISVCIQNEYQLRSLQALNEEGTLDRKLLVALSRAKHQIIILATIDPLLKSPFYEKLIFDIKESGTYLSGDEAKKIFL